MKILIIQQKMIGDVLTSSILFEAIRKENPSAELHYLIYSHTLPVVLNNPYIDKIIEFTPQVEKSKIKFYSFLKSIRKENYDVVIDVYSKNASALISFFSRAKIRIGKSKSYLNWAYTHPIESRKNRNKGIPLAQENRLKMLEPLFKDINYDVDPKIFLNEEERSQLKMQLTQKNISLENKFPVMVNILGSSPDKTYPLPYLAQLLNTLKAEFNEITFLFNYIPHQSKFVDELKSHCQKQTLDSIIDFYTPSLREFIVLTSFCKAMIGNEGGAIHMAKAVNIPSFAIFSPWIRKETWGNNDSDKKHLNVHLKDFKPELFSDKNRKFLRKNQQEYYSKFEPYLLEKKLVQFIQKSIKA
ncbi:glycosyltransferase family 9 protein [uncultured Mesonia sp.]|uniref:glycosyltransferase family 9 protein n=1 Tax=uncultured Mesonia sp. TaxID=399731 RepID=UPI00374E30DA